MRSDCDLSCLKHERLDAWDKCSGLVHWEDPEGSGGEGGGRGGSGWGIHVNPWLIHVNVWQKPLQYCKVISLQLIKISEKTKQSKQKKWVLENWKWNLPAAFSKTSETKSSSSFINTLWQPPDKTKRLPLERNSLREQWSRRVNSDRVKIYLNAIFILEKNL